MTVSDIERIDAREERRKFLYRLGAVNDPDRLGDAVGDKIVDRLMLRLPRLDEIADRGVVSVSKEDWPCVRVAIIDMIYSVLLLVGAGQLMLFYDIVHIVVYRHAADETRLTSAIHYLTVYAFSTENWNRPKDEVSALMTLLRNYMKSCLKRATQNNMCVRVIGDKTGLDDDIRKRIAELEEATKDNTGLHFQIAINYGGRDEIRRAVTNLAEQVQAGTLQPEEITEEKISAALDTAGIPEPDLLIRTCNELRISNFLLWQLAYTEFYFTPVAWPDFSKAELEKAIEAYNHRDRRYGLVKEE